MAGFYTDRLELATTQPYSTSPVFVDITPYLEPDPIEITFGRPDEFSEVNPATIKFRLNISNFPYLASMKLGRRIRWSRIRQGSIWRRFDGHLNNSPRTWPSDDPTYAVADLTATDRLKRLGSPGELRSMVEHEILRDIPTVYYPLGEGEGATTAADMTGAGQPPMLTTQRGVGGAVDFGSGTGPGTDSLPAPQFAPASVTDGKYLEARALSTPVAGASVTLEAFVRCEPTVTNRNICALTASLAAQDDADIELKLSVDTNGYLQGQLRIANLAVHTSSSEVTLQKVNDDQTHHVAFVDHWNSGSPQSALYLDGVAVDGDITYSRPASFSFTRVLAGGNRGGEMLAGTVSHIAAFATNLSATRIGVHANAGRNGMAGERSDQRVGRVLDYITIPAADRQLDVGDSLVGGQSLRGRDPIEVLQEVTRTESGVLFINLADGKITVYNRSRRYNLGPAATLTATAYHLAEAPELPGDDFGMVNDSTVTSANGAGGRFFNQASIDEHTLYRDSKDVAANSADDAYQIAAWDVGIGSTPRTRIPAVVIDLATLEQIAPTLIPTLLAATIGTKLRLAGLPTQAPASTVDVFVEGWTEIARPGGGPNDPGIWRLVFNTSPAVGWDVWQLDVAGHTELDLTTRLAP